MTSQHVRCEKGRYFPWTQQDTDLKLILQRRNRDRWCGIVQEIYLWHKSRRQTKSLFKSHMLLMLLHPFSHMSQFQDPNRHSQREVGVATTHRFQAQRKTQGKETKEGQYYIYSPHWLWGEVQVGRDQETGGLTRSGNRCVEQVEQTRHWEGLQRNKSSLRSSGW